MDRSVCYLVLLINAGMTVCGVCVCACVRVCSVAKEYMYVSNSSASAILHQNNSVSAVCRGRVNRNVCSKCCNR